MDQLGFLHLNQRNVPKVAKVSVTLRRQQQKRFAVVVIQRRVVQCGPRVFANVFPMSLERRNRKCHQLAAHCTAHKGIHFKCKSTADLLSKIEYILAMHANSE